MCIATGKAYWIEEDGEEPDVCCGCDQHRKAVVSGMFAPPLLDNSPQAAILSFEGRFLCNTSAQGQFKSFD